VTRRAARLALLVVSAAAACKEHEFHPPDRDVQVAEAEGRFAHISFDTIQWPDTAARLQFGNEVYASHCRKCHGTMGEGGTEYAASQGKDVPSLVRPDWPYDSIQSVRRRVFAGHAEGMPSWGVGRLTAREIDAVSFYVLHSLRPR
jgi:mono/diheme cytochrome c family protein